MEHSSNQLLKEKLNDFSFPYEIGAWENFAPMLDTKPTVVATKKTMWNVKKWFGMTAVVLLTSIAGFSLFLKETPFAPSSGYRSAETQRQLAGMIPFIAHSHSTTKKYVSSEKVQKEDNIVIYSAVNEYIQVSEIVPTDTPDASLQQHDDSRLQIEQGELRLRATPQSQRISKTASEDSGALPFNSQKTEHESLVKKGQQTAKEVPAAHDLDETPTKKGNEQ